MDGWLCGYKWMAMWLWMFARMLAQWRFGSSAVKMMSGFLLAIDANNVLVRHAIYEEVFATSHGGYEAMVIG